MENYSLDEKLEKISQLAKEKKADEIEIIDVSKVSNITDRFVVCSGNGSIHTRSIGKHILAESKKIGLPLHHKEGLENGLWILIDFGDIVLHIFEKKSREYYKLGDYWNEMVENKLAKTRKKANEE
ncbi:MAG: ribosome silencing factor [Candidatus Cloacimonadota bacterium]|nr:ribosome silencing factor [Candidatus Cloacimonadota bacterium]